MATRIDLPQAMVKSAFAKQIAALERAAKNPSVNPLIREILEKDILTVQTALKSLSEVK